MRSATVTLTVLLATALAAPAFAQPPDAAALCAQAAAVPTSVRQTLVNQLPLGEGRFVTLTGETMMTGTWLEARVTENGAPVPNDAPVSLDMNQLIFEETDNTLEDADAVPLNMALVPCGDGRFVTDVLTFETEDPYAVMQGDVVYGTGDAAERAEVLLPVFPNAPELPAWFSPLNVAVPLASLAVMLGVVSWRRATLFGAPEKPKA